MFNWLASKFSKSSDTSPVSSDGVSPHTSPQVRPLQRPLAVTPGLPLSPVSPPPISPRLASGDGDNSDGFWHNGDAPVSEVVVKIVVIGAAAVGKTSLIYRYVHGCTSPAYFPTIGVDIVSAYLEQNCTTQPVRVDFWDVPFAELYGRCVPRILDGASGIAYVFDNATADSIDAVDEWRRTVRSHRQGGVSAIPTTATEHGDGTADRNTPTECPSVLLAHKSDKKKCLLTTEQLQHYCTSSNYAFWYKTTVADPSSINKAIGALCEKALSFENKEKKYSYHSSSMCISTFCCPS